MVMIETFLQIVTRKQQQQQHTINTKTQQGIVSSIENENNSIQIEIE